MKNLILFSFTFLSIIFLVDLNPEVLYDQKPGENCSYLDKVSGLQGAWTSHVKNDNGEKITITTIVMDGYMAKTFYNEQSNEFIKTYGGSWSVKDSVFSFTVEFSSQDSASVGKTKELVFDLNGDVLTFKGSDHIWSRVDHGAKGDLNGAWLISGRERDGNMRRRAPGARKTMKILSATRFQWIAYNTDTGEFFGTGGGTYTANDGSYTENIGFFSRDNSRVGANLSFEYEVIENEWHHRGLSSKGTPIYEIWSPRIMTP